MKEKRVAEAKVEAKRAQLETYIRLADLKRVNDIFQQILINTREQVYKVFIFIFLD